MGARKIRTENTVPYHMFDTHKHVKELKGSGISEKQAEVIVNIISSSKEADFSALATKEQLARTEIALSKEIGRVETELKQDIAEIRVGVSKIRIEVANIKQIF